MCGCESWTIKKLNAKELMLLNCGAGEYSWESLRQQWVKPVNHKGNQSWIFIGRDQTEAPILWPPDAKSRFIRKDFNAGKDWRQEEKGTTEDEMASLTQWTCVWASPGRWFWTGKPGMLQYIGSQRVRHDWMTEQNKKTSKDGGITYLISDYTTKLQSSRQYGTGTKTEV